MPGFPPQSAALKLLKGNPGQRRVRPELQIPPLVEVPEPPVFLSALACEEWRRVAPVLVAQSQLTAVDLMTFAAYCASYSRWREVSKAWEEAVKDDGMLIESRGSLVPHPLLLLLRQSAAAMAKMGGEFGLTPASRARIPAAHPLPTSKFEDLLSS